VSVLRSHPIGNITEALGAVRHGAPQAADRLLPLVYNELRILARRYLDRERPNHTLQPTALVHEAFLRLVGQREIHYTDRTHFFRVASRAMRRFLVDYARARNAERRVGNLRIVGLDDAVHLAERQDLYVVALDEALSRLESIDSRLSQVVELRFFSGFSVEETAEVMGLSPRSVKRDWSMAKAWLHREIKGTGP